jgi:hypothetical protein
VCTLIRSQFPTAAHKSQWAMFPTTTSRLFTIAHFVSVKVLVAGVLGPLGQTPVVVYLPVRVMDKVTPLCSFIRRTNLQRELRC